MDYDGHLLSAVNANFPLGPPIPILDEITSSSHRTPSVDNNAITDFRGEHMITLKASVGDCSINRTGRASPPPEISQLINRFRAVAFRHMSRRFSLGVHMDLSVYICGLNDRYA